MLYQGRIRQRNSKLYGHENWYGWCIENWGTKWNASDFIKETLGSYYFNTAWTPPTQIIYELAARFPNLHVEFRYYEPGCFFGGSIEFENGIVLYESYTEDIDDLKDLAISYFGAEESDFEVDSEN